MTLRIKTEVKGGGGECPKCYSLGFLGEILILMCTLLKIIFMGKLCWSVCEEGTKSQGARWDGMGTHPVVQRAQPQGCSSSAGSGECIPHVVAF